MACKMSSITKGRNFPCNFIKQFNVYIFNFDYFYLFEINYWIILKLELVFGITDIDDEAQVKTNYTSEPGGVFHMYHSR